MSDSPTPSIFTPFTPLGATAEPAPPAGKKSRKPRAAKVVKPKKRGARRDVPLGEVVQVAPGATAVNVAAGGVGYGPAKKKRAKRTTKTARELKLPVGLVLVAATGLKAPEADLFSQMITALQGVNKAGRSRIVKALGSIFA